MTSLLYVVLDGEASNLCAARELLCLLSTGYFDERPIIARWGDGPTGVVAAVRVGMTEEEIAAVLRVIRPRGFGREGSS